MLHWKDYELAMLFFIALCLGCVYCQPKEEVELVENIALYRNFHAMVSSKPQNVVNVLALMYDENDEKCKNYVLRNKAPTVIQQLTSNSIQELGVDEIHPVMISDKEYFKRLGLKNCPNLLLIRDNIPILYDGENLHMKIDRDDIAYWVRANLEPKVNLLTDNSFEHSTQSATGATTGDWLVWFHRDECADLVPILQAAASRLRLTKVVGEVYLQENPKLEKRFGIQTCEEIYLFRQAKMYKYTADVRTVHTLVNFAEVSYKNSPSQPVKPIPSPFDETLENVVSYIKDSEYGLPILIVCTFVLFAGILVLVVKESQSAADPDKKTN